MEQIKSKIDALVYAIEITRSRTGVDLKKAEEVYDMIISKVELPDTDRKTENEVLGSLKGFFDGMTEQMPSFGSYLSSLRTDAVESSPKPQK